MAKSRPPEESPERPRFEDAMGELERIVHSLEEGELGLEESPSLYEQGVKHLRQCHELLEQTERKIELLAGVDAAGNPVTEPFDEDSTDRNGPQNSASKQSRASKAKGPRREAPIDEPPALF